MLSMRHVAFAALCALGMQPLWVGAQVVAAPVAGSKPAVGVTANGLPIVQITAPNGAGVSNNSYTQYNVGPQGLILNNSGSNVQTQLGGYVTGNPNLGAGGARVIVNQVVGGSASQLLGYTEVAGQKAQVVVANPAGIYCNGCGFINTSRGVLTTGTPVFGGTGSLDAFHVTGGHIEIGAAGLNASNVDQVDLIARSVAVNGKIWAGQSLNVVAGNNDVRYSDLNVQSLGTDGNNPGVAIDVAQLGGMYAGKIMLVGTDAGVGVNSAGTIASQAGDLQLSSQGKVSLSGSTSASGNVTISAAGDVTNTGSVYATQKTILNSQAQVSNSGTIAALGDTSIAGASVSSTGALGAGLDTNGNVAGTGSLAVTGAGSVTATGQQMAGGNLALSASSLNMAGGQTLSKGNASLSATGERGDAGNIVHTGASLQVGGSLTVNAAGNVTNDHAQISAAQLGVTAGGISNRGGTLSQTGAGDTTLTASGALDNTGGSVTTNARNIAISSGSLTNENGTISQAGTGALNVQTGALDNGQGSIATNGAAVIAATSLQNGSGSVTSAQALKVTLSGDIHNTAGRLEAAGAVNVSGANVENTAGRIVSGNGDGLTLAASGRITNAAGTTAQGTTGGVIGGGNGNAAISAASLTNSATMTAAQQLAVTTSGALDNSGGSLSGAALTANAATLRNANGTISAGTVSVTVPQLDNRGGNITANQINVNATNLTNGNGTLTQLGSGAMGVSVSGILDNSSGGIIQTNSTDLTLAPATLNNNGGTITHAGTGTLAIDAGHGMGALTNVGGKIATNGRAALSADSIDDTGGAILAQAGLNATVAGALNNTNGRLDSNGDLAVTSGSAITNGNGTISAAGNGSLQSASLRNSGSVTAGQNLNASVTGMLDNSAGTLGAQSVTANAASLKNTNGTISADRVSATVPQFDNSSGRIIANQLSLTATNLTNAHGSVTQLGTGAMGLVVSGTLDNSNGGLIQTKSTDLTLAPATLNNNGGTITHAGTGILSVNAFSGTGAVTNVGGSIISNGQIALNAGTLDDTSGTIGGQAGLNATVAGAIDNTGGQLESNGNLSVASGSAITNTGGTIAASGNTTVHAASLANSGTVTAGQNLNAVVTGMLDNSGGTLGAQTLTASAASLKNANGAISADTVSATVSEFDNRHGAITADQLSVTATNLTNQHGTITQLGTGATQFDVSGTLDNTSGGVIQAKGADLTVAAGTLSNGGGTITHAGTGTFSVDTPNGTGAITNVRGSMISNGQIALNAGSLDDTTGIIGGQLGLNATVTGAINNTGGQLESNGNLSVASGSAIMNTGGTIAASGNTTVRAASLTNSGSITAAQTLDAIVTGILDNSAGTLSAQTVTASAASLKNGNGTISADTVSATVPQLDNSNGRIIANQLSLTATNLTNAHGSVTQLGTGAMGLGVSGTLDNSDGGLIQTKSTDLTLAPATLNNNGGTITHAGTGVLSVNASNGTGALANVGGSIISNGQVVVSAGSLDDTGGIIGGQTGLDVTIAGELNNTGGQLASNGNLSVASGSAIINTGGTIAASGDSTVQAASLTNGGSITAAHNLSTTVSGTLDNSNGTLSGQVITANATSFRDTNGVVSGNKVLMTVAELDNGRGRITTNQLALTATNLTNEGGLITQLGTGAMNLGVSGALDNSNGGTVQTNSTDLILASASLNNNGGTITHAGTGTLSIRPGSGGGSLANVGGKIVSNGQASISVGSFDNTGGMLASQGALYASVQTTLNNTNGRLSSGTALTATSGGSLFNAGGIIGAGGAAAGSTLTLGASSIDNSGGAITNVGNGATTVNGGSQIANRNAAGASGMGSISGNGGVTLNATSISNTQGGQLSGANLQINTANLDNTGGAIGNVASATGDIGISTNTLTATSGQIIASRNLSVTANALGGGGTYSAVNDLTLNLQGNFTTSPNYRFSAGHNLTFTLPGTFSNGGALTAVNGLTINASDIQNSGMLGAGGLLATHSNTLTNTGTIVGGSVSLSAAQTLSNLGTSALIGATDGAGTLELLSADIENRDDSTAADTQAMTTIYGLGRVVLAGGKDANGNYTNGNLIRNQSGLIQSGGDMEIHANQVTNTRRVMTTGGFTSSVDPALLAQLGISLSGCTAINMAACSGQDVGWTTPDNPAFLTMIGGVYTVPPHGGQWNSGYQYTTYTGVAVANTVTSVSPESQIIAGGNLNAASVGTFQNYWSQVAAAGNIASPVTIDQDSWRGQSAPQVQVTYSGEYHYNNYDNSEHNWQLPFGDAPFVGSRPGGYTQAAPADVRSYALPAYESTFTAGGTLSGTGVTINNMAGNAGVTPLGLLPGQTVSGTGANAVSGTIGTLGAGIIAAGAVSGTIGAQNVRAIGAGVVNGSVGAQDVRAIGAGLVSGSVSTGSGSHAGAVAVQGGRILNSGLPNSNNPTIAAATAVNVLNNITVPAGGLFHADPAPNAPYLIETNSAFTNQQQWLSSDYYFHQMGMNPGQIQLRLGDGFYEQKLVQDQILAMTGKSVLTNYASTQDEFQALMTSGAQLAKSLNVAPGTGLSPEQVAQLTTNVVIMQTQIVDGQAVLVPVVYLAKANQENMGNGPVIAATNIDLQNAQSVTNSGTIKAANSFAISGQSIDSSFGTLQSAGQMSLVTKADVNLTSATLNAGSLALQAGGNLALNTALNTLDQVSATGATRVTTTLGPAASVNVTGNAAIVTGGNFEQRAATLNVGGALGMSIGGNWDLGVLQTGETKVVARANGVSDTHIVSDVGSSVKIGGVSSIAVGGDLTATGANIDLGGGGVVAAKGNVTLQAATATSTVDSNSSGSDHHGDYSESLHTSDDEVTATKFKSGDGLAIVSGKDINVTGSTVSLDKGNALLMASGNVNVGATMETHVSNSDETHSHSGVASHTSAANRVDQTATYADGSTISADGVTVVSGKDINVTGSNIVGTNGVALGAKGNVNILAATDTYQDSEYHDVKHSGLSGSGGIGFSVGSSEQKDQYDANSVTQSQSRSTVGAVQGNVTISAGKDVHIGGSDIIAGQAEGDVAGATGNISIAGQNVIIDPSQDSARSHDQQEARSSGLTVAVKGTPLDAARDLKANASSGNAFQRTQNVLNGIGASAADTPSIALSYGSSHSSSTTDISSLTNAGSTIRGGGNVSVTATGGAVKDANGQPIDGDLSIIGSTISAGGTASLTANRNVTLQASTDQLQQSAQSSSSSMGISLASPGLGDVGRWISGTANSGGTSPSPYNAGRSSSTGTQAQTTQTSTTVSANSVVVKSNTGDINVIGSGITGTQGVDLVAKQGAINVLAGLDTSANHQDSSGHQFGSLGSNGTATGFTVGVSNNHSVQDTAAQTQSTMRSQIVSGKGSVTLDAYQDVTVAGSELSAGKDLTLIGKNVNLDPGTDATQSSASQSSSQFGVSLALGGAVGNAIATVNQSMNNANHAGDSRLAALDTAQAGLAGYNAYQVATAKGPAGQPLIKATVSIGGGSSHSDSQSSEVMNDGSTLHAGGTVSIVATGSGAKDANGFATDGDINARGTQISGQDVLLNAARDINLQSAQDTSQQSSHNNSSGGSIGVGLALGGQQNGFTIELSANSANGHANGNGVTNRDTQINAANTVTLTSGRDTNLRGAEVAGNTVDANVGRDLNIASQQDTNTYDSKQTSAGFQASICVPPICYGTTVSGSASASDQTIKNNYQSVVQQSGIYAGSGGYNVYVGNHTQLDGGVLATTATADRNSLSTQTFGFTNLQNTASYSGESMGFGVSGSFGQSTPNGVNLNTPVKQAGSSTPGPSNSQGFGPSGFSAAGTSSSASGTTYAAVSAGKIIVRGDAGTGQDSTAGLSRDTANANGSVQNTFDAQKVQNGMAIQQMTGQVGMQVVGDIGQRMQDNAVDSAKQAVKDYNDALARGDTAGMAQAKADYAAASQQYALWADDGAARVAAHAVVAGVGAGMGGGSVPGALGGTLAGDIAGNAVSGTTRDTLGGTLLSNLASGLAGAAAGGALGGSSGALSGMNGALSADLYNRQLHDDEKAKIHDHANGDAAEEKKLTEAACYAVQCWAQYSPNSPEWTRNYVSPQEAAGLTGELAWINSQKVPGGLFDYTLGQQAKDFGLSQWDQFSRGAQQLGQDVRNLPHDLANTRLRSPTAAQGDANPLVDVTNGGNGTPPTATAVVTPTVVPCGPGALCPTVTATPVLTPGAPILSSEGNGGDDNASSNANTGSSVKSPNDAMRASANATGTYVDPLTGQTVPADGTLAADHIVPQSWIKAQPGFDQLTPAQQSALLNDPANTQGLPATFNSSKGPKMPGDWQTYKGQPLDPGYIQSGAQQAENLRSYITDQIRSMLGK
ncbi:hemagglutinin repeat-containing protein [Paraburkholderia phenoliruptrix]|uniref:hemagglutinin repeat-containing protein n=1 Tax=Paraburkholderia phenoliruptrix TaxID=252970 RepID=UPI00285B4070|nr:hemagglutinin repeat-containing protein [Paraburkholderia phenoliruptrix]MDR6388448.1 filamentous hemagglutinin [Paraburkholderia phenoliruptrix]